MRCFVMFVTVVCVLFLLKRKWPKNKSFYKITCPTATSPWKENRFFFRGKAAVTQATYKKAGS